MTLRSPRLPDSCDLVPVELDVTTPQFERAEFLDESGNGRPAVGCVYVCLDDDSRGLTAALAMHATTQGRALPIVVRTSHVSGLASLASYSGGGFAGLTCFDVIGSVCSPDRLFAGTHETLARAFHDDYVADQVRLGATASENTALVAWDELSADLRESNLRQADHIVAKLAVVGCDIAPLSDWDAEDFEFAPDEIEAMAVMEHTRWMDERLAAGWTYAPGPKDIARKTTPFLLREWAELSDEIKDIDRGFGRDLPRLLASVGLQVVRVTARRER